MSGVDIYDSLYHPSKIMSRDKYQSKIRIFKRNVSLGMYLAKAEVLKLKINDLRARFNHFWLMTRP